MAILPYWPRSASTAHNMLAFVAAHSIVAFVLALVGLATPHWAEVLYYSPADGVSYTTGAWEECTWVRFPGHSRCIHFQSGTANAWERTVQATGVLFVLLQFVSAVLAVSSLASASEGRVKVSGALGSGSTSLLAAFMGLISMSVFLNRTPARIPHLGHKQPEHVRHLTWSFGLFTAAWVSSLATAPIALLVSA